MTMLRVRAEAADEIGALGRLAGAIAGCRGNIVGLDVHAMGTARVAHEFLVELGDARHDEALARALRRAGGGRVELDWPDEEEPVDPVAHALSVGVHLFSPGAGAPPGSRWADRRLEAAVARLVRADRVRLVDNEDRARWPLTLRATGTGHALVRRWATGSPGGTDGPVWVLVMVDPYSARRRWLVVERRAPSFSTSEAARIGALLRLAHAGTAVGAADGPSGIAPPRSVRRRPASFFRHGRNGTAATTTAAPPPPHTVAGSTA